MITNERKFIYFLLIIFMFTLLISLLLITGILSKQYHTINCN